MTMRRAPGCSEDKGVPRTGDKFIFDARGGAPRSAAASVTACSAVMRGLDPRIHPFEEGYC
jgi:hypothetical protein